MVSHGELLAARARNLEATGAGVIVATAAAIQTQRLTRVGLLGAAFTMEQSFYRDRLAKHGITAIVPSARDRATAHRIIYDELVQGIFTDESREAYREITRRLVDEGAEGVILGCTEIELLIQQADSPVSVFPTTAIHVEATIAAAR